MKLSCFGCITIITEEENRGRSIASDVLDAIPISRTISDVAQGILLLKDGSLYIIKNRGENDIPKDINLIVLDYSARLRLYENIKFFPSKHKEKYLVNLFSKNWLLITEDFLNRSFSHNEDNK